MKLPSALSGTGSVWRKVSPPLAESQATRVYPAFKAGLNSCPNFNSSRAASSGEFKFKETQVLNFSKN